MEPRQNPCGGHFQGFPRSWRCFLAQWRQAVHQCAWERHHFNMEPTADRRRRNHSRIIDTLWPVPLQANQKGGVARAVRGVLWWAAQSKLWRQACCFFAAGKYCSSCVWVHIQSHRFLCYQQWTWCKWVVCFCFILISSRHLVGPGVTVGHPLMFSETMAIYSKTIGNVTWFLWKNLICPLPYNHCLSVHHWPW